MIVYVESNFLLEMALEQEQCSFAHTIVSLAANCQIELAYPSFVLSEPIESIMRARRERNITQKSLENIIDGLERSESHKQNVDHLEKSIEILENVHGSQAALLCIILEQLLHAGRCMSIDLASFREASAYQRNLKLSLQDSIIYSAMIADLKNQPQDEVKCFLSRDHRAFGSDADQRIKTELAKYNCRYIGSFSQGLNFIQRSLQAE